MRPIVNNVKDLYERKTPWGDKILDEVVTALRYSQIMRISDVAALLDCDPGELRGAFHILTGMSLTEVIPEWHYYQAKELIAAHQRSLKEIAETCGWKSIRVMDHVFMRFEGKTATSYVHKFEQEPIKNLKKQLRQARASKKK